jgi:hypothetical protein
LFSLVYKLIFAYICVGVKKMKHIYILLEDDLHQKFKVKCYMEGKTITQTIKLLIEKYVNNEIKL